MYLSKFIEDSNGAETLDALVQRFCGALEAFGYEMYCNFTIHGIQTDTDAGILPDGSMHYAKTFVDPYLSQHFEEIDPVYKLFLHARGPFTWNQVNTLPLSKKQQEVMAIRSGAGLGMGVGIPIQASDLNIVGICIQSRRSDAPTDKQTLTQLYAIANQFHLQRARLMAEERPLALPDISLTAREQEMLQWAAQGKSNGVIAEILGISEKTVEFHLKSIFRKLDVSSRTTAVLKAVHLKLIRMDPVTLGMIKGQSQ